MTATSHAPPVYVGIDTGGTFTDVVLFDAATGRHAHHKLASTSEDLSAAILEGIEAVLETAERATGEVGYVGHGTTVATNAVLQGTVAPTAMITTMGFRDIVEIARQRRPHFFNLEVPKPTPAATRDRRLEVAGRIAEDGSEIEPLDEAAVASAVERLKATETRAVAVCFLHAYADPTQERRARAIVERLWPEVHVTTSEEVVAEFREYERFATTMMNASLLPVMDHYLAGFEAGCRRLGIPNPPKVMQSNGGAVSAGAVRRLPINTLFSGPAGGVIAAARLGREAGVEDLLSFDMGGTSTDVSLVGGGEPVKKSERQMAGWPVRARSLDIHTIGAGGGSLAWIDPGGLLKVGPESAGALPGPAGYGRGGERATVTDADIVLGRLNPTALLGGRMPIFAARSTAAVARLAGPLCLDVTRTAAGIVGIVNANMMGAVRVVSVEQGEDPRGHVLIAFGGAGPLHAAEIAAELAIPRVLVPPRPGLLSAAGLLYADARGDFSLTRITVAAAPAAPALNAALATLAERGREWRVGEDLADAEVVLEWRLDMRYQGQSFELTLPIPGRELDEASLAAAIAGFHERHRAVNGYDVADHPVEIVTLRHAVTAVRPPIPSERLGATARSSADAVTGRREVWFPATDFTPTPVYERDRLPVGARLAGPAIVEQMDATTLVPPGAEVEVDAMSNLSIEVPPAVPGEEAAREGMAKEGMKWMQPSIP